MPIDPSIVQVPNILKCNCAVMCQQYGESKCRMLSIGMWKVSRHYRVL